MHLTRQAVAERVKAIDVFVEMLDARLPGSSANPMLAELTAGLPTLKVLNKQDLADPERTAQWLAHYNARPDTRAIGLAAVTEFSAAPSPSAGGGKVGAASGGQKSGWGQSGAQTTAQLATTRPNTKAAIARLRDACTELAPLRGGMAKPLRVLIGGVPNVGKSTLINSLVGKKTAKTGDEAGVTRHEQRFVLADDFYLFDTPGMLWPRIAVTESGTWLAASGAVGKNAYDEAEVALDLMAYLQRHYPQALQKRYGFKDVVAVQALSDEAALEAMAKAVKATGKGGSVDWHRAGERLIADLRTGALGRITLELPDEFAQWQATATQRDAEATAAKTERERERRKAYKQAKAAQRKPTGR
jgi:ribosome biogenesis GTPase A